ncbi:MAG: hypothetical protein LBK25_01030 [Treponema sp.]|nr:hypothetical protein [Treponema sp.]
MSGTAGVAGVGVVSGTEGVNIGVLGRGERRGAWLGGGGVPAFGGYGDRGAHHKGACLPSSVGENRAPPYILPVRLRYACRGQRRSLSNNNPYEVV